MTKKYILYLLISCSTQPLISMNKTSTPILAAQIAIVAVGTSISLFHLMHCASKEKIPTLETQLALYLGFQLEADNTQVSKKQSTRSKKNNT